MNPETRLPTATAPTASDLVLKDRKASGNVNAEVMRGNVPDGKLSADSPVPQFPCPPSLFPPSLNVNNRREDGTQILFDRMMLQAECTVATLVEKITSNDMIKWGIIKRYDGKLGYQFIMASKPKPKRVPRTPKPKIQIPISTYHNVLPISTHQSGGTMKENLTVTTN